jgi:hypothetical protein
MPRKNWAKTFRRTEALLPFHGHIGNVRGPFRIISKVNPSSAVRILLADSSDEQ